MKIRRVIDMRTGLDYDALHRRSGMYQNRRAAPTKALALLAWALYFYGRA